MIDRFVLALTFAASMANASPLDPRQVEVLDGDTIRVAGETFRLVGFDAPETYRARCRSERELGHRATFRLRQLVAGGGLELTTARLMTATVLALTARSAASRGALLDHLVGTQQDR